MSGNRGFRRTTNTPGGYKNEPTGRVHMYDKIYVGFVKDNRDAIKMGRLKVWIPELSALGGAFDQNDPERWYTVNYCTPFGGATRPTNLVKDSKEPQETQQSYGFWAVPPDLDNEVIVMFINGDPNRGIWIGSLYQQFMNHMIPGMASNTTYDENYKDDLKEPPNGINPPVKEYNKRGPDATSTEPTRPIFAPLHQGLYNEGLYVDGVRGPSTASARRSDDYDPFVGNYDGKPVASENTSGAEIPPSLDKDGNPVIATANNGDVPPTTPTVDPATGKPSQPVDASRTVAGNPSAPPGNQQGTSASAAEIQTIQTALDLKKKDLANAKALVDAAKKEETDLIATGTATDAQLAAAKTKIANAERNYTSMQGQVKAAEEKLLQAKGVGTPRPGDSTSGATGATAGASATNAEAGDPPALVYGMVSPRGNHMYIDDAGNGMIRIRTSNGAQIMINDEVGYIYMITRNGNSWMELSDDGIDMYSSKSISMRAHGDINMHADGSIKQYAAGTLDQVGQSGGTGSYHGGFNLLTDQLNLTSAGSVNIYSPVRVSISGPSVGIAAENDIGITAGGELGITAKGEIKLVGKKVKQNSGKGPQAQVEPIQQETGGSSGSGGSGGGGGGSGGGSGGSGGSAAATDTSNASPILPAPGSTGETKTKRAIEYFMGQGWSKEQAAGIVGNLLVESGKGLNERAVGDSGKAYGIAQWHPDRQANFKKVMHKDIRNSTFDEQLAFVNHELTQGTEQGAGKKIKKTKTAAEAASVTDQYYERSSGHARSQRMANANALVKGEYSAKPGTTATPAGAAPSGSGTADANSKTPGIDVAPQPPEPGSGGSGISGPIEAATPLPSGLNDRELDVEKQYPACSTYTIVNRLVTHEPFELHPTSPSGPVEGPTPGSMPVDPQGDGVETTPINSDIPITDDGEAWVYPVSGKVNSGFGPRTHPVTGQKGKMHTGVDLHQNGGTPAVAAKAGKVIQAGWTSGGYGNKVTVQHANGMSTIYAHLASVNVKPGQEVKAGQPVGIVGSTGRSTGPHLHFEVRSGGSPVDPRRVLPKLNMGGRVSAGEKASK